MCETKYYSNDEEMYIRNVMQQPMKKKSNINGMIGNGNTFELLAQMNDECRNQMLDHK